MTKPYLPGISGKGTAESKENAAAGEKPSTPPCPHSPYADSLTGMVFALEGVRDAVVLINGPMGCKFYHSSTAQFLSVHPLLFLPSEDGKGKVPVDYTYLNDWFFRQPRVPCTCLDGQDYIYGTGEKVREALAFLRENLSFSLLAIVNAPGAALIGDDLFALAREELGDDAALVVLESPGYSEGFAWGYAQATRALLEQVGEPLWKDIEETGPHATEIDYAKSESRIPGEPTVNLLGLSLFDRYAQGDREELCRLFALCGIRVNACLCSNSTIEELTNMGQADLNVVIYPETGLAAARYLKKRFGTPYYVCDGAPVGFAAVEEMFCALCERFPKAADPSALVAESEKSRALLWYKLNSLSQMGGVLEGTTFAMEGFGSKVYGFSRFFVEYFGMEPECLAIEEPADPHVTKALDRLLGDFGALSARKKDILESRAELVFGSANTIAQLKVSGRAFCGIESALPGMGYTDVLVKTQLGIQGSLFLAEQAINGRMSGL